MWFDRYPRVAGFGALVLATGCAHPLLLPAEAQVSAQAHSGSRSAPGVQHVVPVYRIEQPAGSASGQYAVGRIDLAQGRTDAAIERFRQALVLDPTHVDALNGLAIAYGAQGRFDEAIVILQRAIDREPGAAHLLNNLGYAQMQAGRLEEAWQALKRAFGLEPQDARTRQNLRLLVAARQAAGSTLARSPDPGAGTAATLASSATRTVPAASGAPAASLPAPPAGPVSAAVPAPIRAALEVSNGVGINGLAGRTARSLQALGMPVARLTNVRGFGRQQSELYYRDGFLPDAQALQRSLPVEVRLSRSANLQARVDLRLVIGRDLVVSDVSDKVKRSELHSSLLQSDQPLR